LVGANTFAFGNSSASVTNGGTLILNVANTLAGTLLISAGPAGGTVVLRDPAAMNPAGGNRIFMQQAVSGVAGNGMLIVQTDGGDQPYDLAIASLISGTITLDRLNAGTDVTHPFNSLAMGIAANATFVPGSNVIGGTATVTFPALSLNSSFGGTSTLNPISNGAVPAVVAIDSVSAAVGGAGTTGNKLLALAGTTAGNAITGSVTDGAGTLGISKQGPST